MFWKALVFLVILVLGWPVTSSAQVMSGTIKDWPDSGFIFQFDEVVGPQSNIHAWWSLNNCFLQTGFFYGHNDSTQVAVVTDISSIAELYDASTLSYSDWSSGRVYLGELVVFRNTDTGYYAAFRLDAVDCDLDTSLFTCDVTWYFQTNGTACFADEVSFFDAVSNWPELSISDFVSIVDNLCL